MFYTLLLSYPVLAKKHYEVWDGFRRFTENIVKEDKVRCTMFFKACVMPVIDDFCLESLRNVQDLDKHQFYAPFDFMDIVMTLKDNKGKIPFNLIRYDDKRLMRIIAIIQELNISEVMKGWIDGYPKYVYPEVYELYKLYLGDQAS